MSELLYSVVAGFLGMYLITWQREIVNPLWPNQTPAELGFCFDECFLAEDWGSRRKAIVARNARTRKLRRLGYEVERDMVDAGPFGEELEPAFFLAARHVQYTNPSRSELEVPSYTMTPMGRMETKTLPVPLKIFGLLLVLVALGLAGEWLFRFIQRLLFF